MFWAQQIDF